MHFLVIGAGGHAEEVGWSLREQQYVLGQPCHLSFFDDRMPRGPLRSGLGIVEGTLDDVAAHARAGYAGAVLGIGLPRTKAAVVGRLEPIRLRWSTVVHPAALLGPNVSLEEGTYVAAGAVLTVNVRVGRFATVNVHAHVAHGSILGDFVSLHPDAHVSGEARVGDGAELGAGAVVLPGKTIGAWAILGAGGVVVEPLAGARTYVGVPARQLADGVG